MSAAPAWPWGDRPRVCVSLAMADAEALAAALAAVRGADLAEVRLDALDAAVAIDDALCRRLVERSPVPVGFTLRPAWEGGGFCGGEGERRELLATAANAGAGFVDVELDAEWAAAFVADAPCPVIVSHHWSSPRPDDLEARAAQARRLAPSLVKLVAPAEAPADCIPVLAIGRRLIEGGQAASCFCMGEAGRASRLLAIGQRGSLIYAATAAGAEVAAGQWTVARLVDELRVQRWPAMSRFCGLIGHPIEHSLSPAIFNALFAERGTGHAYLPLPGADLGATLELVEAVGFAGLSVTMPFKEEMAARCLELDALAAATGAVNTVVARPGGWAGFNTDGPAVLEALAARMEVPGAAVAIIGAGGAARAAAVALAGAGARVTVINRTPERAARVAGMAGAATAALESLAGHEYAAVINATPVGMEGGDSAGATPLPIAWLSGTEIVFDMVYKPRRTPLLRGAAARGCEIIDGLEMFVRQAAVQYGLLTGEPEVRPLVALREAARRALGDDPDSTQEEDEGGKLRG